MPLFALLTVINNRRTNMNRVVSIYVRCQARAGLRFQSAEDGGETPDYAEKTVTATTL
jgi:hypothetical protein